MNDEKKPTGIECRLCRKSGSPKDWRGVGHVEPWSKICDGCVELWELGKKTLAAGKSGGKDTEAFTYVEVPTHAKMGDPLASVDVRGKDIMTAMGGISLRGTKIGNKWRGNKNIVSITSPSDENDNWYIGGGSLSFSVPKARAEAMKRVMIGFFNAIAKARVDGFNEGRNLLSGLAKGTVSLESFSEQADNARVGKKPLRRGDD